MRTACLHSMATLAAPNHHISYLLPLGTLKVGEFLYYFKFNDTAFLRTVIRECCFAAGDLDDDGEISESEFFLMCSILCTDSRDQVMFRCFTMYDTDKSGFIVSPPKIV